MSSSYTDITEGTRFVVRPDWVPEGSTAIEGWTMFNETTAAAVVNIRCMRSRASGEGDTACVALITDLFPPIRRERSDLEDGEIVETAPGASWDLKMEYGRDINERDNELKNGSSMVVLIEKSETGRHRARLYDDTRVHNRWLEARMTLVLGVERARMFKLRFDAGSHGVLAKYPRLAAEVDRYPRSTMSAILQTITVAVAQVPTLDREYRTELITRAKKSTAQLRDVLRSDAVKRTQSETLRPVATACADALWYLGVNINGGCADETSASAIPRANDFLAQAKRLRDVVAALTDGLTSAQ